MFQRDQSRAMIYNIQVLCIMTNTAGTNHMLVTAVNPTGTQQIESV